MIESDLLLRKQETCEEIARALVIDYKRLVSDTLNRLHVLPDDHTLNFFDIPRRHKGSDALYLAEEMVGKDMVFVSFLGPKSITTIHKHQYPIKENYFQLAGSSHPRLGDNFHELNKGFALTVLPETPHQLTTRGDSSLVLIVMENAISVPRDKLHIPVGV